MTCVSLLVVNYRSASLAAEAIRTAREASSQTLQTVVVDNSQDGSEVEALRRVADVVIAAPRNLGYAGGINRGRPACDGEIIIVSNPDVRFAPSAIDILSATDAAVAGPALFWDDACRWMLPPAELHTRGEIGLRVLATYSGGFARLRSRRRFLARVAFWSLDRPTRVRALSGAVMAIRAAAFDAAGGFDERFPLYFEENDFLRRVRGDVLYLPTARCRHLYNQSAGASPEAASLYAQSERLYLGKWGGSVMRRLEREQAPGAVDDGGASSPAEVVLEASPLANFETAAGRWGGEDEDVSDEIWTAYRGDVLYLRTVERTTGRVLRSWAKARIRT
jgi:N-acetylglucosaminyl-diphospho-decaprenol L-rhamnosyltransferase